jgi:glycosyltransferase involved in cell wall biosynthesis
MKDKVLVSVIIPVYNAAKFVEETIKSVLNQTYPAIEIILIDDASTDASLYIINKFKSDNLSIFSQKTNIGASACRNIGIKNAKGYYIQFLDADDILTKDKIATQLELSKQYEETILIGSYWIRFKENIKETIGEKHPQDIKSKEIQNSKDWLIKAPMMIPHTWLVSRKLIEMTGLWDETLTLNDDGEFFYRVIAKSTGVILSDNIVFYRSFQSSNLSSRNDRLAMISWIKSADTYEKVQENNKTIETQLAVENLYFKIAFSCMNKHDDLTKLCTLKLSKSLIKYNTGISIVEKLKYITGLKFAKKLHTFNHFIRNNKILRKVFGKK